LTLLESGPDEFNKLLVGGRVTEFLLHAEDESARVRIKSVLVQNEEQSSAYRSTSWLARP